MGEDNNAHPLSRLHAPRCGAVLTLPPLPAGEGWGEGETPTRPLFVFPDSDRGPRARNGPNQPTSASTYRPPGIPAPIWPVEQTSRTPCFGTRKPIDLKWGYRNKLELNGLFQAIATRRGDYPTAAQPRRYGVLTEISMRHIKPVFPLAAAFALTLALVSGILFISDSPVYAANPLNSTQRGHHSRPFCGRKHPAWSQHRRPCLGEPTTDESRRGRHRVRQHAHLQTRRRLTPPRLTSTLRPDNSSPRPRWMTETKSLLLEVTVTVDDGEDSHDCLRNLSRCDRDDHGHGRG